MNNIVQKVELYLQKHDLLNRKLVVAFSGGADSMCLLEICCRLKLDIVAAHLNHNWRADESLADEKCCREFCQVRGIEFYTEKLPENIAHTETAAREARYEFFERVAQKFCANAVLTAHNANDNAETVLYRIIKGTGTYGLEGIQEHRGIFYRPLLNVYRHDIEEYCLQNGLKPCVDSSNQDVKYKRNLIRHEILPLMEKINPDVKFAINSLSEIAVAEGGLVNSLLPEKILTKDFVNCSKGLQCRIIHRLLVQENIEYSRKKIENIRDFLLENAKSSSGKTISIAKDKFLFVNTREIKLIEPVSQEDFSVEVSGCGEYRLKDCVFELAECREEQTAFPPESEGIAYVNLSGVDFPFVLRSRRDGDYIQPLGLAGHQKLKKYLNNKKIPRHEKSKLILLCKRKEVLWIPTVGLSEKIKVKGKPTHVMRIRREIL